MESIKENETFCNDKNKDLGGDRMRRIYGEELKKIQLSMLRRVRDVCDTNNLKFFLCGGTLLGAIRHKGFIPWDDDIDIYMPREDYRRFISIFNEYSSSNYKFVCMENTHEYCLPFGKVICTDTILLETQVKSTPGMGVYIDIFPLDGLGNTLDEAKKIIKKCGYYRRLLGFAMSKKRKATPINCAMFWGKEKLYLKYLEVSQKYSFSESKYVAFAGAFYGEREILEHDIFGGFKLHPFEKELYPIPIGYDAYLKKLYGDYMVLPPKEKQVTHHSFVAYYSETEK